MITFLIKHGADVDKVDCFNRSSLYWAAYNEKLPIVGKLLDAGAKISENVLKGKWKSSEIKQLLIQTKKSRERKQEENEEENYFNLLIEKTEKGETIVYKKFFQKVEIGRGKTLQEAMKPLE